MKYALVAVLLAGCGFMGGDPPWNWDESRIEIWYADWIDCSEGIPYVLDKRTGPTYIQIPVDLPGVCERDDYAAIRGALEEHGPTTQSIRAYDEGIYPALLQVIYDLRAANPGESWPDPEDWSR